MGKENYLAARDDTSISLSRNCSVRDQKYQFRIKSMNLSQMLQMCGILSAFCFRKTTN